MEKHHKFSIWYVLIAVWIVFILHNWVVAMLAVEQIPYSRFIKALQDGQVTEVAVAQDRIQGKMKVIKDGRDMQKTFSTIRVDPDLSQILREYDVTFKGVIESDFLKNLASWFVPLFLFVVPAAQQSAESVYQIIRLVDRSLQFVSQFTPELVAELLVDLFVDLPGQPFLSGSNEGLFELSLEAVYIKH